MQVARKDTAQHKPIAMLVNATWEFDRDIFKVCIQGVELKSSALLRDNLLSWKRPFSRWATQWSRKALLCSTFCPYNLALVCPPCFWDPEIGLSSWLTPSQISVAWGVSLPLGMTRKIHRVPGCYLDSALSSQQSRPLNSALTCRSQCFYHHFEKKVEGPLV